MSKKNKEKAITTKLVDKKTDTPDTLNNENISDTPINQVIDTNNEQSNDYEINKEPETDVFNTVEPDKIITSNAVETENSNELCENFINNVFNMYSHVHFIMAKSIDGLSLNVMGLSIDKVPAKNKEGGFLFLSSLEVYETISDIFVKVSKSRNTEEKNIMILVDRSLKVSIFVNGIEDLSLSGKRIDKF